MSRKRICIIVILFFLVVVAANSFYKPDIEFTTMQPKIEINSQLAPFAYIEKITNKELEKIRVDTSHVNTKKLGT